MAHIVFITGAGELTKAAAADGQSIMQIAMQNQIPGIDAMCGGACSCATCHVIVDETWFDRLPAVGSTEEIMLEMVEARMPTSRLSCQIKLSAALDGLVVRVPPEQG